MSVEDWADAFVVPDVGAGGYEEGLAGLEFCVSIGAKAKKVGGRMRGLTAMDMRQMEHSDEFTEAVSESLVAAETDSFLPFWRARSCLCVFLL